MPAAARRPCPHKANPVLATLVRRAALSAPNLAATLHVAAADAGDERPAGAWHAEWDTLRTLLRRTVVAAGQTTELVAGLEVHPDRMAATLDAARDAVRSEQRAMADLAGPRAAGRLPRRHRRLHRGPAGPGGGGPRMIPVVTGVRMSGAAHRAELPLLVLGPSLGTNAVELWTACADLLTDSFDVLAWDLPGHGHNRAVSDEGFTMAELAEGVLALVADVQEQRGDTGTPFAYAGVSVGGAVGLVLLLDHPDRVTARRPDLHRRAHRRRRHLGRSHRPGHHLGNGRARERDGRAVVRARLLRA